jgi:hypothetical protein
MMQDMHSTTEDVNTMLLAQKELEQLQNENNIVSTHQYIATFYINSLSSLAAGSNRRTAESH